MSQNMEPDVSQNMEPDVGAFFSHVASTESVAIVSIAISLKRIADALDVTPQGKVQLTIRDILSGMEMNTRGAP